MTEAARKVVRGLLLILAVFCLVVFLSYEYQFSETAAAHRTQISLGCPGSPWFIFLNSRGGESKSSFTSSWHIEFVSWSWLFLAAVPVSLRAAAALTANAVPASDVSPANRAPGRSPQ